MPGDIFLIQDKKLVTMTEQAYDSEALLQELLADYPDLLAGRQMDSESPRRWLLVKREAAVPGEQGGAGRWSVDHLFLDQDGIPTLVEVKRSSDTRIRREVIGQMLDYAANGVAYWPEDALRSSFASRCAREGRDADAVLAQFLGPQGDAEAYWQQVSDNLQAGRIRMVFVADQIPPELRRVVEFLNGQMDPAEVLAVEIRQFLGDNVRTMVPRVLGNTERAEASKRIRNRETRQWDEPSFFAELQLRGGAEAVAGAREVLDWGRRIGLDVWWGQGRVQGSYVLYIKSGRSAYYFAWVTTTGRLLVTFDYLSRRPAFAAEEKREELRRRLNETPGIDVPPDALSGEPPVPVALLAQPEVLNGVTRALEWAVGEVRAWETNASRTSRNEG